jgi:hypothetical protein
MELIPNQPINFDNPQECECEIPAQIVNYGDVTQAQFTISPCPDAINLVENGAFDEMERQPWGIDPGGTWIIADNKACKQIGLFGQLFQTILTIQTGKYYKIEFTVSGRTAGEMTAALSPDDFHSITSNGTFEFYYYGSSAFQGVAFGADEDFNGCVSDVFIFEVDIRYKAAIKENGELIRFFDYDDEDVFNFDKDKMTISIDWSDYELTPGCYEICLFNPCSNVCSQLFLDGQDFQDTNKWSKTVSSFTGITIASGEAKYLAAGGSGTGLMKVVGALCDGLTYEISYTLNFNNSNLSVQFEMGTGAGGAIRTSSGNYTETLGSNGGDFIINFVASGSGEVTITNLLVKAVNASLQPDICSNEFKLGQHKCTVNIRGCSDSDVNGFSFVTTGFTPNVRVEGALIDIAPETEREHYTDSRGKRSAYYSTFRNKKELRIGFSPAYVHNFLALLLQFDNVFIDGVEYFIDDDEYQMLRNDDLPCLPQSTITLVPKVQKTVLSKCSPVIGDGCGLPPFYVIDPETGDYVIDPETGEKIISLE